MVIDAVLASDYEGGGVSGALRLLVCFSHFSLSFLSHFSPISLTFLPASLTFLSHFRRPRRAVALPCRRARWTA